MPETWEPKVIAAIDFGTHGSGYAWATVADIDADRRYNYSNFPGGMEHYPKNLSAVLLTADGDVRSWGHRALEEWKAAGAANPDRLGYASRFKMAIRVDPALQDVPEFAGSLAAHDRSLVRRLVVHVLRMLREQVLAEIAARTVRVGGTEVAYSPDDIRWCVTIPAIWESHERDFMRQAAVEAGLPDDAARLLLAIEPEAAAVYCAFTEGNNLSRSTGDKVDLGRVGSRFMVVDCGGGTVDLSGYRVVTTDGNRHGLTEIGLPNGGKLGSEYINQAFRAKLLGRVFGAKAMARIEARHGDSLLAMEQRWEQLKIGLPCGDDAQGRPHIEADRSLDIPQAIWSSLGWATRWRLKRRGLAGKVPLPRAQTQALFDPVVEGIIACIEQQLLAMRDEDGEPDDGPGRERLLLVGGFAMSAYLAARITRHFAGRVDVVLAKEPAIAVLAGAVRFARDPSVIWARRSKYTYGFSLMRPARPGIDAPTRHVEDDEGTLLVSRFAKVVTRGESVPVGAPVESLSLYPVRRAQQSVEVRILASLAEDPQYPDDPGVTKLGTVPVPLHDSVGQPASERAMELSILAGNAELDVRVVRKKTGEEYRCAVSFEEEYPR